ncbi:MAG TPA: GreA/GreB family elongation factor [Gemmatimonadota bacterium]|jgi:transcription elongation factor GreA
MLNEWKDRMGAEIAALDRELRVDLPREIRRAVELGDLRENAEYQAALERQEFVRARLSHLQRRLGEIGRLNPRDIPHDRIALGSRVVLELEAGETLDVRLVLPEFVEEGDGTVSISSPIARALVGKVDGDRVTIELPDGSREASVRSFETLHAITARASKAGA